MVTLDSRLGHFYRAFYNWASWNARHHHQALRNGRNAWRGRREGQLSMLNFNVRRRYSTTEVAGVQDGLSSTSNIDGIRTASARSNNLDRPQRSFQNVTKERVGTKEAGTPAPADGAALGQSLRIALRRLTQPVVVVTAANLNQQFDDFDHFRGVTVSSFSSIALKPTPYICFNIKLPSRTWDAIETLETIYIHILRADEGGMSIAHAFTQPHRHPAQPFRDLERAGVIVETPEPRGPPVLGNGDQVIARIAAKVVREKCVTVGDHILVVAEVVDVTDFDMKEEPGKFALSYGLGEYRSGGESLGFSETPVERGPTASSGEQQVYKPSPSTISTVPQRRHFSSTAQHFRRQKLDLKDHVSDPSLLQQTIGDFMGVFQDPAVPVKAPGAMKLLVKLKDEADEALKELEALSKEGEADSEEALMLDRVYLKNSRFVLRTLAKRSAVDLRRMLDVGKVDYRLTDYMEATIEKGQAFLIEETGRLQDALERGTINEQKFQEVGRKMQEDYNMMREVTDRLKMITEDDDGSYGD